LVVSNPVDILTQLAVEQTNLPAPQVIGLGTALDTSRFCSLIASSLKLPATQVRAMILGEHGDTMVPIWSSATVGGFPLLKFPASRPPSRARSSSAPKERRRSHLAQRRRRLRRRRCNPRSHRLDRARSPPRVLPISSFVKGVYGIRDVSASACRPW
jgi:L-lactate dehydrogenase